MLYDNRIGQLSILGSSVCNLSCNYCYLHNQQTQFFYNMLNKEIQEKWKNGEYVNNIKKVFKKIKSNPNRTTRLEIWGGEPLIEINNMLQSIENLFQFLPNLTFFMIPTNFGWNTKIAEQIATLAKLFDKTRNKELLTKPKFHIQMSIDGIEDIFSKEGHNVPTSQYLNNIEALCQALVPINLEQVQIVFEIHSTASMKNILNELNTTEKIIAYYDRMYSLWHAIKQIIKKHQVQNKIDFYEMAFFPLCATPENSSSEEGIEYTKILKMAENIFFQKKYINTLVEHPCFSSCHSFNQVSLIGPCTECVESNRDALMILPDGTITECACSFVQNRSEYLNILLENNLQDDYNAALIRKTYFFNPLTATQEEQDFNDWYNLSGLRHTFSTQTNLAMGMCQELALSRQILFKYALDPELLYKHITMEVAPYSCTREQIRDTRIPYISHPGDYRRIFNGVLDFTSDIRKSEYQQFIKNEMRKWNDQYNK